MSESFAGKVILVTGGTAGIGEAAVRLLVAEGARVVFAGRNEPRAASILESIHASLPADGHGPRFLRADFSHPQQIRELVSETIREFGRIDGAFNNAAALGQLRNTAEYSEEEYDTEMGTNLKSVWLCMKYELEQMQRQSPRGGAIVNTSSVNGLGGARGGALYSAAKAAILALTKSAAQEYAPDGIRINALVAGGFDTEMLRSAARQTVGDDPQRAEAALRGFSARVPLGRIGTPAEAAQAALWLLSDASSYVTGHSLIVDGGMTAWAR
jgi:NAD(P)-dependent dehydrogenase (short-subunit alcohol dehydrogenase family)